MYAYAVTSDNKWKRASHAGDAVALAYSRAHETPERVRIRILPRYADEDALDSPTAEQIKLAAIHVDPEQFPTVDRLHEHRRAVERDICARLTRGQLSYLTQEATA